MAIFITERQLNILNEASKKEVEINLKRNSESLFLHLLKVYYWGYDDDNRWHWIKEASNKCTNVKKLPNNKYPTKENIKNLIWEGNDLDELANQLNRDKDYKSYIRIDVDNNAKEFCNKYIDWLSEKLSIYGNVDNGEAQQYLLELYNKYN